ncbi:MAG: alcohol dehydrogenase catalytic domain-containing protein [Desulfobacterales bacterium]|nr:alcohol dehydrogenase catalytic domain-containing protein [Desulfobacterales bacterium]
MKSIYFDVSVPKILSTKAFSSIFPSVYYSPMSPVRFGEIPERDLPGAGWVRVRSLLAGICGADISLFFVQANPKISIAALPGVPRVFMGHEVVGEVVEAGPDVDNLKIGDRVTLQKYLPCCSIKEIAPQCRYCDEGNYTLCENFSEGTTPENLGAGFGNFFIAHYTQLVKIPDTIPDDIAVLIEPAAVSLHALLRHPPEDGDKILIIGAGTIGLNVIQFAKAVNPDCTIYLLEKIDFKKSLGLKLGADHLIEGDPYDAVAYATGGKLYRAPLGNNTILGGFDIIYDCVGYSKMIHDSLRWLKARGTYVMIGNQLSPVSFDQTPVWQQEINMIGVNAHGREIYDGNCMSSFDLAIDMIQKKKVNLAGFITHRFHLTEYRNAFKLVKTKSEEVIKAVFDMSKEPGG